MEMNVIVKIWHNPIIQIDICLKAEGRGKNSGLKKQANNSKTE